MNATITLNVSATGGGLLNIGQTLELSNTIVAANTATSGPDVHGAIESQGHNLIGDGGNSSDWMASDLTGVGPLLGPLQDNGGTTPTHALLLGSLAIDAGDNTTASTNRSAARMRGRRTPMKMVQPSWTSVL